MSVPLDLNATALGLIPRLFAKKVPGIRHRLQTCATVAPIHALAQCHRYKRVALRAHASAYDRGLLPAKIVGSRTHPSSAPCYTSKEFTVGQRAARNAPSVITLDLLRVALRWVHLTAAVVWIGGTFFYLLVIRPAVDTAEKSAGWGKLRQGVERRFHEIVQLCIWTFFISGGILTYDRLTSVNPGLDYIAVLVLKVLLVIWMVFISGGLRRAGVRKPISAQQQDASASQGILRRLRSPVMQVAIIGSVVLLLADVLKVIAEIALRSQ